MNTKRTNKVSNFLKIWIASFGSTLIILTIQLYAILTLGREEEISETISELAFIISTYSIIGAMVSVIFAFSYQLLINEKPTKKILISTFFAGFIPHFSNIAYEIVSLDAVYVMFIGIAIIVSIGLYILMNRYGNYAKVKL